MSRELQSRGMEYVLLEASNAGKSPSINYLTSPSAAASLGLTKRYQEAAANRKPITGYVRYDASNPGLTPLEEIVSNDTRTNGFVTFSLAELREWLGKESGDHIYNGKSVCGLERSNGNWITRTTHDDAITSQIVIDATGSQSRVLRNLLNEEIVSDAIKQRTIRACYGGVYPYGGSEDILLFADRFPAGGKEIPREGAGWVMPLGNGSAEVVVGWETTLADIPHWHTAKLKHLLEAYIRWFNIRGIPIAFDKRQEVVSGSFSQGLLDYRSIPSEMGISAFGESLGLNHPLNGYLIRNIAGYARIMADEAQKYLDTCRWNPHNILIATSPVNFGQQVTLSRRKMKGVISGSGRSAATGELQEFLVKSIGASGLWKAIDEGVPLSEVIAGLARHPQYAKVILTLGWDYAKLLLRDGLYRKELKEKIVYRFSHV